MFNFITNVFKTAPATTEPQYIVTKTTDGKWAIFGADGEMIKQYTRRGDAFRGAERAGLRVSA